MTLLLQTGDSTPEERAAYLDKRTALGARRGHRRARASSPTDEEAQSCAPPTRGPGRATRSTSAQGPARGRPAAQGRARPGSSAGSATATRTSSATARSSTRSPTRSRWSARSRSASRRRSSPAAPPASRCSRAYFGTTTTVVAAGVGAIAAAGASMVIKENMKGAAYGGEDIATDLASRPRTRSSWSRPPGSARRRSRRSRARPRSPCSPAPPRAGCSARMAVKGAGDGIEGLIQGLPTGMMARSSTRTRGAARTPSA